MVSANTLTRASAYLFAHVLIFPGNSQWELLNTSFISGRYTNAPPIGWDNLDKSLPNDVISIQSKGKFIYFNLNNGTIWNTLGLTGGWRFQSTGKHNRSVFLLKNKKSNQLEKLYFYDQRNFGTLKYTVYNDEIKKKLTTLGTQPPTLSYSSN